MSASSSAKASIARLYAGAWQSATTERMADVREHARAMYGINIAPDLSLPAPAPTAAMRLARFDPSRHCTPATPEQIAAWRASLAATGAALPTAMQSPATRGDMYAPVYWHGSHVYTTTGIKLATVPATCPEHVRAAIYAAVYAAI